VWADARRARKRARKRSRKRERKGRCSARTDPCQQKTRHRRQHDPGQAAKTILFGLPNAIGGFRALALFWPGPFLRLKLEGRRVWAPGENASVRAQNHSKPELQKTGENASFRSRNRQPYGDATTTPLRSNAVDQPLSRAYHHDEGAARIPGLLRCCAYGCKRAASLRDGAN
jgi:hypothetical protein